MHACMWLTCSVSEFTSSIGSIHVNSPDSVNKFGVSIRVSGEITSFFTWWHVPVNPYQFWPSTTRVKLVQNLWQPAEHVYSRENTYWWSGTNYEPVWHLPTGSEMVPCLLGYVCVNWILSELSFIYSGHLFIEGLYLLIDYQSSTNC